MRLLLVSTYELGRQPVHLGVPAAAMSAAGIDIELVDVSVDDFPVSVLDGADAVAFSVPMHTAMRLAVSMATQIRAARPSIPIAFYGLYAGVGYEVNRLTAGDAFFAGEYLGPLVEWVVAIRDDESPAETMSMTHKGQSTPIPDRSRLPGLERYARLEFKGQSRIAGAVEASRGCRHRCTHCPVPVVYDGRIRLAGVKETLADIDNLVTAGVEHVTFGDPDFLNAPRYSLDILQQAHASYPELTFDATVKVEHILRHREIWPEAGSYGLLFVISAFESVHQDTLDILAKDHTVEEAEEAVVLLRGSGIHIRPTWLPFLPWTTTQHILDLVDFLDRNQLWNAIDPVQLAIKLLIPEGSLLEDHPVISPHLRGYDPDALTWKWEFADQNAGVLFKQLDAIAADASDCGQEVGTTLQLMRDAITFANGVDRPPIPSLTPAPRLTESWFCCAEPTQGQATAVSLRLDKIPTNPRS